MSSPLEQLAAWMKQPWDENSVLVAIGYRRGIDAMGRSVQMFLNEPLPDKDDPSFGTAAANRLWQLQTLLDEIFPNMGFNPPPEPRKND